MHIYDHIFWCIFSFSKFPRSRIISERLNCFPSGSDQFALLTAVCELISLSTLSTWITFFFFLGPKVKNNSKSFNLNLFDLCVLSHLLQFDSVQPHGLWPVRLLCPWDFPDKNTGVGCHLICRDGRFFMSTDHLFVFLQMSINRLFFL